jgi:hypothetical protein
MTIQDRVRDALHDYADPIEPGPGSWERISERLGDGVGEMRMPRRPYRRPLVLVGAALAVVVVLVVALAVRDDEGGNRVATTGTAPMPSRILAVTTSGQPVILDAATGSLLRELPTGRVLPERQIAVTPDGRDAYFVAGSGDGCANTSIQGLRLSGGFGLSIPRATAPAISPDGRHLAYLQCPLDGRLPDAILLRDLRTGEERDFRSPAGTVFSDTLVFADSRLLLFETDNATARQTAAMQLDVENGAMSARQADFERSLGWVRITDDHDYYLMEGPAVLSERPIHADTPAPELELPAIPDVLSGDTSGRHFVLVVGGALYRWSEGDDAPTKVADGIVAASWIPDAARVVEPTAALPLGIVAASNGRLVVLGSTDGAQHSSLGTVAPDSVVSATAEGRTWVVGPARSPAGCDLDSPDPPGVDVVETTSERWRRLVGNAYAPVVSSQGLVAYGYACDGNGLGFTRLATGENYRSDALGGRASESDERIRSVLPLAWSPDGTRLLYWVGVEGAARRRLYVGRLWPAVRASETEVLDVEPGSSVSAATFVDADVLAVGTTDGAVEQLPDRDDSPEGGLLVSTPLFEVPGGVALLTADPSGEHFLAVTEAGDLYRWSRGDAEPTLLATAVTSAAWLPWS